MAALSQQLAFFIRAKISSDANWRACKVPRALSEYPLYTW